MLMFVAETAGFLTDPFYPSLVIGLPNCYWAHGHPAKNYIY